MEVLCCSPEQLRARGAYALARGALVEDRFGNDFYAYPFMNAEVHGYAIALLRCAVVAALLLGLAWGAYGLDRRLPGLRDEVRDENARSGAPAGQP